MARRNARSDWISKSVWRARVQATSQWVIEETRDQSCSHHWSGSCWQDHPSGLMIKETIFLLTLNSALLLHVLHIWIKLRCLPATLGNTAEGIATAVVNPRSCVTMIEFSVGTGPTPNSTSLLIAFRALRACASTINACFFFATLPGHPIKAHVCLRPACLVSWNLITSIAIRFD